MPYRTWLLIAALGLIFSAALGQTQEQTQEPARQTQDQQEPAQSLPIPFPVEIVKSEAEAEARQRQEEEARQREIEDLIAQQGMNAATQEMNWATQRMAQYAFWYTVFAGIGTVFLVGTLYFSLKSIKETRHTTEIQNRAFIQVYKFKITYGATKSTFIVHPHIENTGNVPADSVVTFCNGRFYPAGEFPSAVDFNDNRNGSFQYIGLAGPRMRQKAPGFEGDVSILRNCGHKKGTYFIWGFIEYSTFGKRRITRYCILIETMTGEAQNIEDMNIITANYPAHNCADEGCEKDFGKPLSQADRSKTGKWILSDMQDDLR